MKEYGKPIVIGAMSLLLAFAVIEVYRWWKEKQKATTSTTDNSAELSGERPVIDEVPATR